jgi:uncharacterized protein (TIRG00374 family)
MNGILSNRKTITGIVIGVLIGLFVIAFFSAGFGFEAFISAINSFSWIYLLSGFGVYSFLWLFEMISFKVTTSKFMRVSYHTCFKTSVATQFVNLVTPFMSGGQVATIFVLNKAGLNIERATSAMIIKSMMFQTFVTFFSLISLATLYEELTATSRIASIMGMILNMTVIFIIMIIGINKTVAKNITAFIVFLLEKIKILKLTEERKGKLYDNIEAFNEAFKAYKDDWKRLLKLFVLNGCQFCSMTLSAFIVLKGFGLRIGVIGFFRLFLINSSALIVPTPGTSGGAEGLYYLFMAPVIPDEKIAASIIVWRLCTYYMPLLLTGFLCFWFMTRSKRDRKL